MSGHNHAVLSSLPSSGSISEHQSHSSITSSRTLQPKPSGADSPSTANHVPELSLSSEENFDWSRRQEQAPSEPSSRPGCTCNMVSRYLPLIPPAALLITLVLMLAQDLAKAQNDTDSPTLPDNLNKTVIKWIPCTLHTTVNHANNLPVQCATMILPLCYEDLCNAQEANATIAVSFKRIGANINSVSAQTVWYLPDRPDLQTQADKELQMTLLYEELHGKVDIYTLDMRGTGNSTALVCNSSIGGTPLQTAIFARNDGALDYIDVQSCASQLRGLGYSDLRAFSLASSARDVEEVIKQFQSGSQAIVYALGYGTLIAQQLMQRGVSQVIGYAFDGALGGLPDINPRPAISYQISKSDEDFGEVAAEFLEWCQSDTNCSKRFSDASMSTTLDITLLEVYARLDSDTTSTCAMILMDVESTNSATTKITPPSYLLRQLLGLMMKDSALWAFIPVVVYRFRRCGAEDLLLLKHFVNSIFGNDFEENTPELIYAIQAFSELWETPSPDQIRLLERFTSQAISPGKVYTQLEAYCLFRGSTSDSCANTSASNLWSVNSTLSYANELKHTSIAALSSGTSVLLFSGGLDALSPPKYATALYDTLQNANKALIVAPYGMHGVVQNALLSNGTACARRVLASYVQASGNLSAYDASCMTMLPIPSLAISNASSLIVLGAEDAYDGTFEVDNSSRSSNSTSDRADVLTERGSLETSAAASSTIDKLNRRFITLKYSRHRYKVEISAVASILGAVVLICTAIVMYRCRRKQQLADQEIMLRCLRVEFAHDIYFLSTSSVKIVE